MTAAHGHADPVTHNRPDRGRKPPGRRFPSTSNRMDSRLPDPCAQRYQGSTRGPGQRASQSLRKGLCDGLCKGERGRFGVRYSIGEVTVTVPAIDAGTASGRTSNRRSRFSSVKARWSKTRETLKVVGIGSLGRGVARAFKEVLFQISRVRLVNF